jgi:hypothetical protein
MVFAMADVITTWYALTALHLREANPVAKWAIAHLGLSSALTLRVVIGAAVLALIAWGSVAPIPWQRPVANRAFAGLLVGVVAVWGVVAMANAFQIALIKLG